MNKPKADVLARYRQIPDEIRQRLCDLPVAGVIVWWWSNVLDGDWPCEVWATDPDRVRAAADEMGAKATEAAME